MAEEMANKNAAAPNRETESEVAANKSSANGKGGKKSVRVTRARGKKRTVRNVSSGRAYIQATYNNTIVTLTDQNGNVLGWSSAGVCGFRGPKKSTPYAAGKVAQNVCEKAQAYGLGKVDVFLKGIGSGRESAVRALSANGLTILSIRDMTPIPHNGCRPRKARRV